MIHNFYFVNFSVKLNIKLPVYMLSMQLLDILDINIYKMIYLRRDLLKIYIKLLLVYINVQKMNKYFYY
jgi:hypothetical protein